MTEQERLDLLDRQIAEQEEKAQKAEARRKALLKKRSEFTRRQRTHRLCTRGAMLETFLQEPELLTDEQVQQLLEFAFAQTELRNALYSMLAESRTAEEERGDNDGDEPNGD